MRRRKGGNFAPVQLKWGSQKQKPRREAGGFEFKRSSDQYFALIGPLPHELPPESNL